jgi:hypothetical protein
VRMDDCKYPFTDHTLQSTACLSIVRSSWMSSLT